MQSIMIVKIVILPIVQKKGKQLWSHFPFNSSVSYHQKFVSIICFLVLSVSAMYGQAPRMKMAR